MAKEKEKFAKINIQKVRQLMPFPHLNRTNSVQIKRETFLQSRIVILITIVLIIGCTPMIRQEPPKLSGTFSGNTPDGRPIKVTLIQEENTVTGRGLIGEKIFSLSAITSYHGPMVLSFEDGTVVPAYITLSPDGTLATIRGLGIPLTVNRGGEPLRDLSGPFAGHYSTTGPPPLWLTLTQGGDLLAGTGFIDGKPVAVVGKVTGPNRAAGTILFSDESQNRVKVNLSGDGRILTIEGLGGIIEMRREL
jgi:hypothetical protein